MPYFVIGSDGNEYGPVEMDTLKTWVAENRVLPTTILKDAATGQSGQASYVPGLFAAAPPTQPQYQQAPPPGTMNTGYQLPNFSQPPQPTTGYPRQVQQKSFYDADPFPWRAFIYPLLSLVSFFVCGGFGFIFGGYGLYYAIQVQSSGSKYGIFAIVWAGVCLAAVLGGYALGLRHGLLR